MNAPEPSLATSLANVARADSFRIEVERRLGGIDRALSHGALEDAHVLLDALARNFATHRDPALEFATLLRYACLDLARSRHPGAHRSARAAAEGLRQSATLADEIDSLVVWSRAAGALGRGVESLETAQYAAQLASQLTGDRPSGLHVARAHVALGIALGWSHAFAQSARAFRTALNVVARQGDEALRLEVVLEAQWVNAIRIGSRPERDAQALRLDADGDFALSARDRQALLRWADSAESGRPPPTMLLPGQAASLAASAAALVGLLSAWSGDDATARRLLDQNERVLGLSKTPGWLLAAEAWLAAELARRDGDLDAAGMHASRMTAWAAGVEHLPLAALGHGLSAEILRRQGQFEPALDELSRQLGLQTRMQLLHIEGREHLVRAQVELRNSEAAMDRLSAEARKFESWAHEDALTGIANLRRFTQCLEAWLPAAEDAGRPLCVALIDVDRFKQINDGYSYNAGDDVLRGIAEEMRRHVRPDDLPVRWGGDEFAILFRDTDLDGAREVARRVQRAIAARDWSSVAEGLQVGVSIGVTRARPGDSKRSLVERCEEEVFAEKHPQHRRRAVPQVVPEAVRRIGAWLREAQRVVVFVGSGTGAAEARPAGIDNVAALPAVEREFVSAGLQGARDFVSVAGRRAQPQAFEAFWREWRVRHRPRQPLDVHRALVELSHRLPQVSFVTERIDGVLALAGAVNVVELYGNAFRDRFGACGHEAPRTREGHCAECGHPATGIRPDITLLGEYPDARVQAGAELAIKLADVVLVVDCDAITSTSASLLAKGRDREVRIAMLGTGERTHRGIANVWVPELDVPLIRQIAAELDAGKPVEAGPEHALSAAGYDVLAFLTGRGGDNLGVTLEEALGWKDWEIAHGLATLPWMFPLPTRSRMNPTAPSPTADDFVVLAGLDAVRQGMRAAFLMMLRFYGFEWSAGEVRRAEQWRLGFSNWATSAGPHDLFISRILGAMTLCGLREEARAFLLALTSELRQYRGGGAERPLVHWQAAVAQSA